MKKFPIEIPPVKKAAVLTAAQAALPATIQNAAQAATPLAAHPEILSVVLSVMLFFAGTGLCHAQGLLRPDCSEWFSVPESHGYTYTEEMVEGGGGLRLLTRIYLPDGEGPWPVIVTRTPHTCLGRGDTNTLGREYAKRGIGYIQQDCRGRGGSEGIFIPDVNEREDGTALYHWLEKQDWCGDIGIFGHSYSAFTGWIVADSLPEKVKGLYLSHCGVDRHISCYRSGLFRQDIMGGWMIDHASEPMVRPQASEDCAAGENYYGFYLDRPHITSDVAVLGQQIGYYRDWIAHTDYNDPYWNMGVWGELKSMPEKIRIPVTIVTGQFDHQEEGTLDGYERLSPEAKRRSRLILGSWDHDFKLAATHVPASHAGDFDVNKDLFDWFYSLLVRRQEPRKEVMVYAVGDDKWMRLSHWPMRASKQKNLYLSTQKAGTKGNVLCLRDGKGRKGVLGYDYDPADPVMTVGGESISASVGRRGSQKQPKLGYREDVLSFISAPLKEDMTIAGAVTLSLRVSTDVDDTAFAFTLSEITPSGASYNIRTAIATLAYRDNPLGSRQSYKPGKEVDVEIVSSPVIWTVKKGNYLRIDVKSSDFPEYAVHTNFAGIWSMQEQTRIAHQKVFVGGRKGSVLTLPLY